jgi:hypothetical protein
MMRLRSGYPNDCQGHFYATSKMGAVWLGSRDASRCRSHNSSLWLPILTMLSQTMGQSKVSMPVELKDCGVIDRPRWVGTLGNLQFDICRHG